MSLMQLLAARCPMEGSCTSLGHPRGIDQGEGGGMMVTHILEGRRVRARVVGWTESRASQPSAPLYDGVGAGGYVTGTLTTRAVYGPLGRAYVKHMVGPYDVDAVTIRAA